jgi:hypothetical protein
LSLMKVSGTIWERLKNIINCGSKTYEQRNTKIFK